MRSIVKSTAETIADAATSIFGRAFLYSGAVLLGADVGISLAMHTCVSPWRALCSIFPLILGSLVSLPTAFLAITLVIGLVVYLRYDVKPWLAISPFAVMMVLSYWLTKSFMHVAV